MHELLAQVLAGNPAAGGFEVQYQPIVRLAGSETVAVEALACWRHPAGGEVEFEQLMSVAQRTGLSGVIEDFVLMQACADAEALSAAFELDVSLHVNVGSGRLTRPDLVTAIEWAVKRYKLEASRLVIEIAHTHRVDDPGSTAKAIQRIRDRGVRVALDDVGEGCDILAQLDGLPTDLIKLRATRTEAECQAVVQLCQRIGLTVVAQGIATAGQARALQEMGCELGQGMLYGPALRLPRDARDAR